MHSFIYEVSSSPIPQEKRAKHSDLPEWFHSVCDYADDLSLEQRQAAIRSFVESFHGNCTIEDDKITFAPQTKVDYFKDNYHYFRSALSVLDKVDLNAFSGTNPAPVLYAAVRGLMESYEDNRGIYIYDSANDDLLTLDSWLRTTDFHAPIYLGGVVDYHS